MESGKMTLRVERVLQPLELASHAALVQELNMMIESFEDAAWLLLRRQQRGLCLCLLWPLKIQTFQLRVLSCALSATTRHC